MIALRAALCPHIKHSFRDVSEHQLVRRPLRAGGGSSLSRPGASCHRHTHFELRRCLYPAPPTQPLPRPNPPPAKLSCGIHSPKRWAASLPNRFHSCISFMTICRSVPLLSPSPPPKEGRGTFHQLAAASCFFVASPRSRQRMPIGAVALKPAEQNRLAGWICKNS